MAKEDEELQNFIGQEVTDIRRATDEEYEKIYDEDERDEYEEGEALMVAVLKNGCKLYLLTEKNFVEKTGSDELEDEGQEVAIAELKNGDVIEIPAE